MLILPEAGYRESFLAAYAEDPAARPSWEADGVDLGTAEGFDAFVERLRDNGDERIAPPAGLVASTSLWWVADGEFLARVSIRHRLLGDLVTLGGHIGYWVRPSARGRGHATAAFRESLPWAYALGLDPVLLTCDHDNVASRRVIEAAGGVFEGTYGPKRRYWVPTRPQAAAV